ncbi:MAG: electron transporter SenC [Dehalococcoidia bacterium]|nr:electron transporter SenC [Dehalococcoidia bacterium]HCU99723.1 SCO family protein [Dehalococcoidia bacterium]
MRSVRLPMLAVAVLLGIVLVSCGGEDSGQAPFEIEAPPKVIDSGEESRGKEEHSSAADATDVAYRGARATPPIPKPDLVLADTNGKDFNILAETEGYLTLLYLGYTHCPDICPTHMLDLAKTLETMDPEQVERIRVIFITTDPARDDAASIRRWLDLFDESFVGLTIDDEALAGLLSFLGMPQIIRQDLGDGRYSVNHGTYLIAFTTDNLGHIVYPFLPDGGLREIMRHDLPLLIEEGW